MITKLNIKRNYYNKPPAGVDWKVSNFYITALENNYEPVPSGYLWFFETLIRLKLVTFP